MLKRTSGLVDSLRVRKWAAEWLLVRLVRKSVALLAVLESVVALKLVPNSVPRSTVKFVGKLGRLR